MHICTCGTVCTTRTRDQGEGWSIENPKLFSSGTVCVSAGEAGGKGVFSVYTQPSHIRRSVTQYCGIYKNYLSCTSVLFSLHETEFLNF
jgi:hypothetical protein